MIDNLLLLFIIFKLTSWQGGGVASGILLHLEGSETLPCLGGVHCTSGRKQSWQRCWPVWLENVPYAETAKALGVCQSTDHPLQPCGAGTFVTIPV